VSEQDRENKRLDRKIAQLEHEIVALKDCIRLLASKVTFRPLGQDLDPSVPRAIEQRLNAELATRPR
jgi:hypothetical protein